MLHRSRAATPQLGAFTLTVESPSATRFSEAHTLIEALDALPDTPGRGFRFRALDGSERELQWRELAREAQRRGALLLWRAWLISSEPSVRPLEVRAVQESRRATAEKPARRPA